MWNVSEVVELPRILAYMSRLGMWSFPSLVGGMPRPRRRHLG